MQRKLIQSSENAHDDHTDVLGKIGELQDPEVSRTPSAALLQNVHDKEVHAELDARTKEVEERDKQLVLAERCVYLFDNYPFYSEKQNYSRSLAR